MSQELPSNKNNNEEVDLIVFFNLIGNLLNKVYIFISSVVKAVFSFIISALKVVVNGWKVILGVLLLAYVAGYFLDKSKVDVYTSDMLVTPYSGSKFQLVTNIGYYNALIASRDYDALSKIFNAEGNNVDVKSLLSFKIEPGPETENDRVLQYQNFARQLDSFAFNKTSYDEFIENRSIFTGDVFLITAKSTKKDVFKELEDGINVAFNTEYSRTKRRRDSVYYELEKDNIKSALKRVNELQTIYIDVLQKDAENLTSSFRVGELPLTQEKPDTKEYELLTKELELRNNLRGLEEKRITQDVLVDVISSFQQVGNKVTVWYKSYTTIIPILALLLLAFFHIIRRTVRFVNNYEK